MTHDAQRALDEAETISLAARIGELAAAVVGQEVAKLPPETYGPRFVRRTAAYAFFALLHSGLRDVLANDPDPQAFCTELVAQLETLVRPPASSSSMVN